MSILICMCMHTYASIKFRLDNSTVICDKTELRFFHRGNFCSVGAGFAVAMVQVLPLSPQHHDCLILGSASLLRGEVSKQQKVTSPHPIGKRSKFGYRRKTACQDTFSDPLENDVIGIFFRKGTSPLVS